MFHDRGVAALLFELLARLPAMLMVPASSLDPVALDDMYQHTTQTCCAAPRAAFQARSRSWTAKPPDRTVECLAERHAHATLGLGIGEHAAITLRRDRS